MSSTSNIEWTDASWTPLRARCWEIQDDGSGKERIGWHCEHVSEGCRNCYAERLNLRLGTGFAFKPGNLRGKPGYHGGGVDRPELFLDDKMLTAPLHWRKPRMIFVCSMTDLFADFVADEWIDKMFAVMALCPQHTFQVLTKRAERMREYITAKDRFASVHHAGREIARHGLPRCLWPLPNVWLGVSAERQQEADERIPHLLDTPAAVRFVSCEPLLGPIDLTQITVASGYSEDNVLDALTGFELRPGPGTYDRGAKLDWVIVGGESGPNARPMHPDWARSLRDQCAAADVPFFFKQWGEFAPALNDLGGNTIYVTSDGRTVEEGDSGYSDSEVMERVGKKRADRLLDGVEHNAMPQLGRGS